jgi:hypothetical protein
MPSAVGDVDDAVELSKVFRIGTAPFMGLARSLYPGICPGGPGYTKDTGAISIVTSSISSGAAPIRMEPLKITLSPTRAPWLVGVKDISEAEIALWSTPWLSKTAVITRARSRKPE